MVSTLLVMNVLLAGVQNSFRFMWGCGICHGIVTLLVRFLVFRAT